MSDPILTLAPHLESAARLTPAAPALLTSGGDWDFAGLWREIGRQAADLTFSHTPLPLAAGSTALAFAAYACSLAGRPLWPLDPEKPAPAPARAPATAPGTALVISTSGSEGEPKAAMLSAANLDAAAAASNVRLPLGPGDIWLDCLPLFHIGGQSILWRCARAGAAVLLHEGFDAGSVVRDLAARRVTHLSLVPAMLARLLDLDAAPPPFLRCVLVGGAALSKPLYERAMAAGWPLFPTYGMSETAAQVATFDPASGTWEEGLVGHPLPGNEVSIGTDGRVRLRGPQVMLGYLEPGGRAGVGLEDGWFATGDLGRIEADGCLRILGRADAMLVSGGSNVHPLAVESCLAACPGIADVAVAGLPHPVWGDLVVALVVGEASDQHILDWSRARLPAAARPRRIVRLERLPRNAMGKLERGALRAFLGQLDCGVAA
ncbi:MAG: AMP-dependent synthetase and ligase [Rhodocyclaceae bacterium]|nr:AMP-dependent synthetase and ligase [Rhodocyclaceae bacterium]